MSTEPKEIDNGGSAFPKTGSFHSEAGREYDSVDTDGMSLRDWFAGKALTGIVAGLCSNSARGDRAYDRVGFSDAAEDAYTLADAMIAARKGGAA